MTAFNNSPETKADVLAQLHATPPPPILNWSAEWETLPAWSRSVGLPVALTMLISALAGDVGEGQVSAASFVHTVFSALQPGADAARLPHRWVVWAWSEAPQPIGSFIISPAVREAAQVIVDLHRRAAAGEVLDRALWRPARSQLSRLGEAAAVTEGGAAEVVAAGAWDFETVPGAGADVFFMWLGFAELQVRTRIGWTAEKSLARDELGRQMVARVEATLPPPPPIEDEASFAAYRHARMAAIAAARGGANDPLFAEHSSAMAAITQSAQTLQDQCCVGLLELIGAAPVARP